MWRERLLACGVLALAGITAGCGGDGGAGDDDGDPAADPFESGTRIRARGFASEDGGRFFVGWFDAELDTACEPSAQTEDGVTRCLPPEQTDPPVYFSDPGCATRVAPVRAGTSGEPVAPRFVAELAGDLGRSYYRFYEAGPVTTGATYEQLGDGTCELSAADASFVPVGAPVPPDAFAEVTERLGDGGRIVGRTVETADGARAPAGLAGIRDVELDVAVEPRLGACGQSRWVPVCRAIASDFTFADPACTEPVATSDCDAPAVAEDPSRGCELFALGAPVAGDVYIRTPSGACAPQSGDPRPWYRIGAAVDLAMFEPVDTLTRGGDRLRDVVRVGSDGAPVEPRGPIYDAALDDARCDFALATDGVIRCLPADVADGYDPAAYVAADEVVFAPP